MMLQGQKHARISKITVLGRSWVKMTMILSFFSRGSACKVVEREKLPHAESIGNMLRMFFVVKKTLKRPPDDVGL